MNPYTNSLLAQLSDDELKTWVRSWDSLEALIIEIYRQGELSRGQRQRFSAISSDLHGGYNQFKENLAHHWRGLQAGGEPLNEDPFMRLLSAKGPEEFVDNWPAMQLLPAAREALNLFLHERLESKSAE